MKRMYTVEFYRDMLARCREIVPGVAISSDFIVGFAGETEESFQKTCDLVRDGQFKNSFIFKYSTRPGTKGHDLYEDDIPEEVKKRRNNDLLAIQNAASLQDHRRFIGERVEVLVEGPSKNAQRSPLPPGEGLGVRGGPLQLTGRTRTDHIVVFDGNPRLAGQTMQIDIVDATSFTLYGNVVTGEQVGVENIADMCCEVPIAEPTQRLALPLIG